MPVSRLSLIISGLVLIAALAVLPGREAILIRNSLWLAAGSFLIAWPAASVLAVSVTQLERRGRFAFWCGIAFLVFLPIHVQAAAWDLRGWVLEKPDTTWDFAWWAAAAGHGMAAIPWLTLVTAWQLPPHPSVTDSLRLDATADQALWHALWPRWFASLPIAAWLILIQTLTDITLTDLYQVRTYAEEVYVGFSLGDDVSDAAPRVATWTGLVPGLFAVWLTLSSCVVIQTLSSRYREDSGEPESPGRWREHRTASRLLVGLAVGILSALVAVPLMALVYRAGIDVTWSENQPVRQWSMEKIATLTCRVPRDFAAELGWTVLLGQFAAIGGFITVGVWSVIARKSRTGRWLLYLTMALSLVIPGPVVGLTLDRWGSTWGGWLYDRTVVLPVAALGWHILPWQAAIVWSGVSSLPADQWDAARLQGTNFWQQWTRIVAPQRGSCLITAWFVGFLLASSDLSTTILVMPPGISTISVRLFGLLHAAADDRVAALCLFISGSMAVTALAVVVIWHRFWRSMRRTLPAS